MSERNGLEIAILGMAGRFPKAKDLEIFWQNLRDGVEGTSFFTDEELAGFVPGPMLANPNYVKAAGVLDDTDRFDAAFFDYSPREAEILDPQQRILLEVAWEALERTGYAGTQRPVGVFAGVSQNTYLLYNILTHPEIIATIGAFGLTLANEKDFVATRLGYKLNLEGPCVNVQTACSTSLVATHMACQSLLSGECELALAGGVTVWAQQKSGHIFQPGGILSPDGHTRAFDAKAQGTSGGQGVGVVVLKLLEDALTDGDSIQAVIKGSAVNNDGSQKPGFTAPRRDGQAKVIRAAQARAEVDPESIGYIETHGTATPLGDPIEVAALTRAFRLATRRKGFCAIGSVKTNIGHLDAAAGVAGLIKATLAVERGEIPPSLYFESPNPEIDFESSPFYVNTRLSPWPVLDGGGPRRAAVSAFGIGGTNAHVILEEAPSREPSGPSRPWQILLLSARTPGALEQATDDLAAHLKTTGQPLADVAYTLRVGRRVFEHRRALVASSAADAAEALAARDPKRLGSSAQEAGDRPVAFLLPGVGDQYAGMAAGLYRDEPVFRQEMDRCAEILRPHLDLDLRDPLFGGPEQSGDGRSQTGGGLDLRALLRRADNAGPLYQTRLAQPVVFALGYSLAQLWISWGLKPQALLGYSLGEFTAACLAGVLSLEDAAFLVAHRARLIDGLPPGAMLAVPLSEEELRRRLPAELSIAAVNAPSVCVVAGASEGVAELERTLAGEGLPCRPLQTSHAFHSTMMRPIAGAFRDLLRQVELRAPRIPYLSNVTGTWIQESEATDPEHWVRHLCGTVRFAEAAGELWREPGRVLLEVGPGQSLGSLALQHPDAGTATFPLALPSLRHEHDRHEDQEVLLKTLSQLWLAGVELDAAAFYQEERRRRVPLPTYPFERQRYWIDRSTAMTALPASEAPAGKLPLDDWFHVPTWKLSVLPSSARRAAASWLLLTDGSGLGSRLAERLAAEGRSVTLVSSGPTFQMLENGHFVLDPRRVGHYELLLEKLGTIPEKVVHLWTLGLRGEPASLHAFEEAQDAGFYSLLSLTQAIGKRSAAHEVEIAVVTDGLCAVERGDLLLPERATLLGPARVISQEYPSLSCRAIDIDLRDLEDGLDVALLAELEQPAAPRPPVVALRGDRRWLPSFEPVRLERPTGLPSLLRAGGVYLITGGLGGIGLALAEHLARVAGAKLALLGRSALPDRSEWQQILESEDEVDARTARRIRAVQALETAGTEALLLAGDVSDEIQMREAVDRVRERFGRLDGVFHAAGVPGAGLIQLKPRDLAEEVIAPKAQGALALAAALRDVPVDFLVLFSAVTALTGGVGQVDYCAANSFLDSFAQSRRAHGGPHTLSVNWCEWQWDDWASSLTAMDPRIQGQLQRQRQRYGLTFDEGMEALSRALASGLPQVIVSTRSLRSALEQQHSVADLLSVLDVSLPSGAEHPRPVIGIPYVAPSDDLERQIAGIWQQLLGIEAIGIHDDFFQLGGHSLLGLQVLSRIYEAFQVELPLRVLFEGPTVAEIASEVAEMRERPAISSIPELRKVEADPGKLLENLDALSDDEVDALLAEMSAEERLAEEDGA